MPLPGGPAAKLGNRYENWWTVSQLVRMLQGGCESIRIEVPGVDEAEFVVALGDICEWHQAKRSHPAGQWTIARLASKDCAVLTAAAKSLDGNSDQFVFVSATGARELEELADRAREAKTPSEFETAFVATKGHAERFKRLRQAWKYCDLETAYDRLRRIVVRTVDERGLAELTRSGIRTVYLGRPDDLTAALRTIAEDSTHAVLTRVELIAKLAERGFKMRRAVTPDSAMAMVNDATRRYLDTVRGKLIQRALVPRSETQTLLGIFGDRARDVVLSGRAGGGKTGCVFEFVSTLQSRGVPVLALRLDRIDPVSTAEELGRGAGLEESPALVLAAAAQGREAVLVIDQLDAISTASGRSTSFYDAIEGTLTETRGLRERANIHVIVVCREFDWENDHRLKKLLSDEHMHVSVDIFSIELVRELLTRASFDPALLLPRQLELIRLPQNLSLFLDAMFDRIKAPVFNTATDLFTLYWDVKRRAVRARAGGAVDHWINVIDVLVEEMTRAQQLSVSREKIDAIDPEYLDQMSSEGVLTFDGWKYGFGHESFFDYCFARLFVGRQNTLADLLRSGEQHLFCRSQVRQVLTYLRQSDRARYLCELKCLATDARVRPHIKDLAFALLGSVDDPSEDEWSVWEPLLQPMLTTIEAGDSRASDKIASLAWQHFFRSPTWFTFAVDKGLVATWLATDGSIADMAVNLLRLHEQHASDIVAVLLQPYVDTGGAWPSRLRWIVEWSDHTKSRLLFDLTLRLIDNGALDMARGPIAENSTFWSMFYQLGQRRPEWVPEVISHWLRRRLALCAAEDADLARDGIFRGDDFAREPIGNAAANAPIEFVRHVLPVVLELVELAVYGDTQAPRRDSLWPMLVKRNHLGADDACLSGLAAALAALSRGGHDLRLVISDLRGRTSYIANYLLQTVYEAGADRFADEAAEMLVEEPWRFECGYADSTYWTSTELVRAISSRCDSGRCARLEATILGFVAPWERTERGYRFAGYASFSILSAFPHDRLSISGRTRLIELERKFGQPAEAPRGVRGGIVGSPIAKNSAEKMTDAQWLSAMQKYRETHRFDSIGDFLKGGAAELAQTLGELVTQQPERFATLALRLPPDTNPVYMNRILDGLKTSDVSDKFKFGVCRRAFAVAREASGQSIADVLAASEERLPDDLVDLLEWLATEHPDPDQEAWQTEEGGGQTYYRGDIYTNGINTTRGRAVEAIRDLIARDPEYVVRFRNGLERMVRDPSICVRSCVAGLLRSVAYHDTALALELLGLMAADQDERLLTTVHMYELIRSLLRDHFDEMRPTIERMLRSSEPSVAQAGGRLTGLAALHHARAADLDCEAAAGNESQRRGLAEVAAANITLKDCRAWCEGHLVAFFNDTDALVRKEAADSFRQLRDESLEDYEALITAFTESVSYRDDSMAVFYLLEHSLRRLPGITCIVCEKFLDRLSNEVRDMRLSRMGDADTVTRLVFRTYHQHQQNHWGHRALGLIDRLCLEGIDDARKELDSFDR